MDSISEVDKTINSYYTDKTKVYINIGEQVDSTKVLIPLALDVTKFKIYSETQSLNVFFENIYFINGNKPFIEVLASKNYVPSFSAKNCKFLYRSGIQNYTNGIDFRGSKSVLINCEASYNGNDGFNYHEKNGHICLAIEINCIASNNGIETNDKKSNGSTIHDGSYMIRINGTYFNNNGANVADVDDNSISFNFNCKAFDSLAGTKNEFDSDFCSQADASIMYLYNCFSKRKI